MFRGRTCPDRGPGSEVPGLGWAGGALTVTVTSPTPTFPAASATRACTTYVPACAKPWLALLPAPSVVPSAHFHVATPLTPEAASFAWAVKSIASPVSADTLLAPAVTDGAARSSTIVSHC